MPKNSKKPKKPKKPKKQNANRVKSVPGYKGLPQSMIENKVISINEGAFKEIDKLEQLVKHYETLVALMETEWEPKKTASRLRLTSIAHIRAVLSRERR